MFAGTWTSSWYSPGTINGLPIVNNNNLGQGGVAVAYPAVNTAFLTAQGQGSTTGAHQCAGVGPLGAFTGGFPGTGVVGRMLKTQATKGTGASPGPSRFLPLQGLTTPMWALTYYLQGINAVAFPSASVGIAVGINVGNPSTATQIFGLAPNCNTANILVTFDQAASWSAVSGLPWVQLAPTVSGGGVAGFSTAAGTTFTNFPARLARPNALLTLAQL